MSIIVEHLKLEEESRREKNWKRWGPYLSERQWGTVREDYSTDGNVWEYFKHDHARMRAYRWGEDGLMGLCDRECRLCFSVALWNGKDSILKERLFGLTGSQGNHGEDVKECYYYVDNVPTHSYMKGLYKYPQAAYPYSTLETEAKKRTLLDPEYELEDTNIFKENKYFDVYTEYAKNGPDDIFIKVTATNRGQEAAPLHIIPTLWFRNTWIWGCEHEGCSTKPLIQLIEDGDRKIIHTTRHDTMEDFILEVDNHPDTQEQPEILFTENESNSMALWGAPTYTNYVKDGFHRYIIQRDSNAVNPKNIGTKACAVYKFTSVPAGESRTVRLRLSKKSDEYYKDAQSFSGAFEQTFEEQIKAADQFYEAVIPSTLSSELKLISRQSYAGLLWTKQFYHYVVEDWLRGDKEMPPPPQSRLQGRNNDWGHLFNRDVISMPDKWEYPWYAAWDLAFHMIPFCKIDPHFSKSQLLLLLREWYMHPNGQIPAYEFNFSDVNPPVHAWACLRVYKITGIKPYRDRSFLAKCFQKLVLNFTWWVNRKDIVGKHLFSGGFLGLDNIGLFDRSKPLKSGSILQQADGTAWMAFYCTIMLEISLELALHDSCYEDMASKFFEHFVHINEAMSPDHTNGLWDERDKFYYDTLHIGDECIPIRIRSLVGIIPIFSCLVLEAETINQLPEFKKRMEWFLHYKKDLAKHVSYFKCPNSEPRYLLSIPTEQRLRDVLRYVLDEKEFLSEYGIRSLSKFYDNNPYNMTIEGEVQSIHYVPGDSDSYMFGGNSNWRGPIWFPINYLIIEALERYHYFYGDEFKIECPTGSGNLLTLKEVAKELCSRLIKLFKEGDNENRPCHGNNQFYQEKCNSDLILFYEYFNGDNGKGVGASHQTGWTALISKCIEKLH